LDAYEKRSPLECLERVKLLSTLCSKLKQPKVIERGPYFYFARYFIALMVLYIVDCLCPQIKCVKEICCDDDELLTRMLIARFNILIARYRDMSQDDVLRLTEALCRCSEEIGKVIQLP